MQSPNKLNSGLERSANNEEKQTSSEDRYVDLVNIDNMEDAFSAPATTITVRCHKTTIKFISYDPVAAVCAIVCSLESPSP